MFLLCLVPALYVRAQDSSWYYRNNVIDFAPAAVVSKDALILLKTAALFHDTGFLFGDKNQEQKAYEIAETYLPGFGYDLAQIDKIKGMIMAPKIQQTPNNHLEQSLANAASDYLSRDDFFIIEDKLYNELAMFGTIANVKH